MIEYIIIFLICYFRRLILGKQIRKFLMEWAELAFSCFFGVLCKLSTQERAKNKTHAQIALFAHATIIFAQHMIVARPKEVSFSLLNINMIM